MSDRGEHFEHGADIGVRGFGSTCTALRVTRHDDGSWMAQTVVDV